MTTQCRFVDFNLDPIADLHKIRSYRTDIQKRVHNMLLNRIELSTVSNKVNNQIDIIYFFNFFNEYIQVKFIIYIYLIYIYI